MVPPPPAPLLVNLPYTTSPSLLLRFMLLDRARLTVVIVKFPSLQARGLRLGPGVLRRGSAEERGVLGSSALQPQRRALQGWGLRGIFGRRGRGPRGPTSG